MSARLRNPSLVVLALLVLGGVPRTARAAESEYDPLAGYGLYSARVGLWAGFVSGTVPASGAELAQKTFTAEFNGLLFDDHTVFGTLLGIEFDAALGLRTLDKPTNVTYPDGSTEGVRPVGRADFEFAYDLVRWKILGLRQRIILNAGGGFDYNMLPWTLLEGSSGWRAYPLLGGHVQTSVGNAFVLDVSYRFVPTQSKDGVGFEHRAQVSLGIKRVVVGAHFTTTRLMSGASGPADETQLGGFASWAL